MTNEEEVIIDPTNNEEEIEIDLSEEDSESINSEEDKKVLTPEEKKSKKEGMFKRLAKDLGYDVKKPEPKPEVKQENKDSLSSSDMFALLKANVHEDDIEDVKTFARAYNLDIKSAIKDDKLKAMLKINEEKRASSEAANVGPTRRTTTKVSPDELMKQAQSGKLPESDDDIAKLMEAKLMQRE